MRLVLLIGLMHGLLGCASNSILVPYPVQMNTKLAALDRGEPVQEINTGGRWSPNRLLHYLEQGRLTQINQQNLESKEAYRLAIAFFDEQDLEAVIELSEVGEKGASLVVNDNTIGYEGEIYERGFVHLYQALNYLFEEDLEGAGVEIRRLNRVQKNALAKNEKALIKLKEKADSEIDDLPIDIDNNEATFDNQFSSMDVQAAKLKYSFQNGYGFYLSALIYELRGELNDAYIDYKKALELNAANTFIQQDVIRLAKRLGFTTDFKRLNKTIELEPLMEGNGEIVVIYEDGFSPQKEDVSFSVMDMTGTYISVSFPVYNDFSYTVTPLTIRIEDEVFYETQLVAEVSPMAAKALKDKRPGIMARQIARGFAKARLQKESEKNAGALGSIIANIYNIITERADLRSWLSLPNNVQVGRYQLPVGEYPIMVRDRRTGVQQELTVTVREESKTIINVINTGGKLWVRSVSF